MKKLISLFILTSSVLFVSYCNLAPGKKTESTDSKSTSLTTTSDADTNTSTKEIASSYTFYTSKEYLPFDNYGIHISNQSSGYQNRDKLKDSINTQVGTNLVTSLNVDGCNILTDDGTANKQHLHLTVGGGSSSGYIEFALSINIIKVQIEVIAYYKSTFSLDVNSQVDIDGDIHAIPNDSSASTQQAYTFDKTYSNTPNKFKLSNHDEAQRFFLESVTLFY